MRWLALVALIACAPKGLNFPGPIDGMGQAPSVTLDARAERTEGAAAAPPAPRTPDEVSAAVVRAAAGFVGAKRLVVAGSTYRYDCSGFVEAVYAAAGQPLRGSAAMMYEAARSADVLHRRKRKVHAGDLVFWDDTYDRNANGRRDDDLTHVGIVEGAARDGRVSILHLGGTGVRRITMDLRKKHVHTDEAGVTRNDYLRVRRAEDPWRTKYLAGELWVAYASPWRRSAAGSP
jgi:cell wall-associated NlpC family hydrolase